jgi:hypothetical protein
VTSSGSGYRSWTVTEQVQAMMETGTNHGFLIRDLDEGGSGFEQSFHAREKGENPPQLVLRYTPAPSGDGDGSTLGAELGPRGAVSSNHRSTIV